MRVRIEFLEGMAALDGACACILERFAEDALCVVLESGDCPDARLLLGDVSRVIPDFRIALDDASRNSLGVGQGSACAIYCRLRIPQERPQTVGFDLDHLVLINFDACRGMELDREGQGVIPFSAMKTAAPHGAD